MPKLTTEQLAAVVRAAGGTVLLLDYHRFNEIVLPDAHERISALERENVGLRVALRRYESPANWGESRPGKGPMDLWLCLNEDGWNGPDYARAALSPPCHICGKPKGSGEGRCCGHYAGTSSDPALSAPGKGPQTEPAIESVTVSFQDGNMRVEDRHVIPARKEPNDAE